MLYGYINFFYFFFFGFQYCGIIEILFKILKYYIIPQH